MNQIKSKLKSILIPTLSSSLTKISQFEMRNKFHRNIYQPSVTCWHNSVANKFQFFIISFRIETRKQTRKLK